MKPRPLVPLRRVAALVNGGTPTPDPENWTGDVPWATPVDLARYDGDSVGPTERTLTRKGAQSSGLVTAGSVVLSTRAPIGYVAIATAPLAFNQGCKGLLLSGVDPRYLMHFLWASRERLQALGSGSTFMELGTDALMAFELPLPPLGEQRRIADFLDDQVTRIDNIIQARQEQVRLMVEQTRSFLVGATLGAQEPAIRIRRLIESERLGAWGEEPGPDERVRVVRVADFNRSGYIVTDAPTVRTLPFRQQVTRFLQRGDVLLERSGGGEKSPVGFACLYDPEEDVPTITSNFVSRLRPAPGVPGPYLSYVLAAMYEARRNLAFFTQTTGIQNLDSEGYLNQKIPARSASHMVSLADLCRSQVEASLRAQQALEASRTLLQELKRSVISAAVSGDFDVSVADGSGVRV